jgi:transglutaminase-like putative cysteine protease
VKRMKRAASEKDFQAYLRPTQFIDSDAPAVAEYARSTIGDAATDVERGGRLYYAVRDPIRYDPYAIGFDLSAYKASAVLAAQVGFCIQKAILLAAVARAVGIPSRLGFADVRNHLTTERLRKLMGTDVFAFHGYTELYLDGRWVKATPAFNRSLCERFKVRPLEFDGKSDSVFHPFDTEGRKHMEYLRDHGHFADFPFEGMVRAFKEHYGHLFQEGADWPRGNFEQEALAVASSAAAGAGDHPLR